MENENEIKMKEFTISNIPEYVGCWMMHDVETKEICWKISRLIIENFDNEQNNNFYKDLILKNFDFFKMVHVTKNEKNKFQTQFDVFYGENGSNYENLSIFINPNIIKNFKINKTIEKMLDIK